MADHFVVGKEPFLFTKGLMLESMESKDLSKPVKIVMIKKSPAGRLKAVLLKIMTISVARNFPTHPLLVG